jgi:hypothetical protein
MSRGPVHVGDVLRAAGELGVSGPADLRALLRLMGLTASAAQDGPGAAPPAPATGGPDAPAVAPGGPYPDVPAGSPAAAPGVPPGAVPPPRGSATAPAGRGEPREDVFPATGGSLLTFPAPDGWPGTPPDEPAVPPGADAALFATAAGTAEHPPAPPWNPRTQRAIMLAVAATEALGREIDQRRLTQLAVRRLSGLPRTGDRGVPYRTRPTTRAGLHILLDRGPAMRPFRHDMVWMSRLARTVLPPDTLRVADFRLRQGVSHDGGRTWHRRLVLARNTPVLLVSDLGFLRPPLPGRNQAPPGEWLSFLRRLKRAGHPVVCVTPYRPEAYPAAVRRSVALVPMDRRTSMWSARSQVTRAAQGGRRA